MKVHDTDHESECPRIGSIEPGAPSSWGPVHDGKPNPGAVNFEPTPARPFTPQHVACLRGPCRHYFSAVSHFDVGNPADTFEAGKEPTQRHHMCTAAPGVYMELTADSPVYECNRWSPMSRHELAQELLMREEFYRENPELRPEEVIDDLDIDEEDEHASGTD